MDDRRTQWYIGAPNGIVLCVNAVSGGRVQGVLYHSYSRDPVPFSNMGEMTFAMERVYDALKFPHPSTNTRTFVPAKSAGEVFQERSRIMSDESLLSKHGDIGTFIVRVQHRQNSSWQGRITWMEEDKTVCFRSIWEMIKLIENAVDTVSDQEEEGEQTWFSPET